MPKNCQSVHDISRNLSGKQLGALLDSFGVARRCLSRWSTKRAKGLHACLFFARTTSHLRDNAPKDLDLLVLLA